MTTDLSLILIFLIVETYQKSNSQIVPVTLTDQSIQRDPTMKSSLVELGSLNRYALDQELDLKAWGFV
jgi:hypothetical protein